MHLSNRACKTTEYFHSFDLDHDAIIYNSILEYPSVIIHNICLQEFAVPNCVEGATYDPWKALSDVTTYHNYRWVVVGPLELSVEVFFAEKETFLLTQNVPNAEKSVRPTFA